MRILVPAKTDQSSSPTRYCVAVTLILSHIQDYGSQTDPTALNPYVNRIGYHFEGNLFKEACDMCGYRVVGDELIPPANQAATFDAFDVSTDSSGGDAKGTERMRALAYMEELFPKMPVEEREECYEHAWEVYISCFASALSAGKLY